MARLPRGEKERKRRRLLKLLYRFPWGLREREIAEEMGWHRRTANNYLRELARQGVIRKEGRLWVRNK